jgi:opacity protein-like surface antigen
LDDKLKKQKMNFKLKIKLFIASMFIMLQWSAIVSAQTVELGIRYMPTFSNFYLQTSTGGKVAGNVNLGFGAGGVIGVALSNHVSIQGEIIYNSLSQKYKEVNVEREVNLKYVNIPLLLSLNTGRSNLVNLNVVIGPQVGISAGSALLIKNGGSGTSNAILSVNKGDLGFAYGAGLDFALRPSSNMRLTLGYRGVQGLFDISDDSKTLNNDSFYLLSKTHIHTNAGYIGLSFLF